MPSSNTELLKDIQAAVAASPALVTQLQACKSPDELAALLSRTLSKPVSAADLQTVHQEAAANMTDEQLDSVAAGKSWGIVLSFASFGFGCAVASVISEIHDKGCKKRLDKEF